MSGGGGRWWSECGGATRCLRAHLCLVSAGAAAGAGFLRAAGGERAPCPSRYSLDSLAGSSAAPCGGWCSAGCACACAGSSARAPAAPPAPPGALAWLSPSAAACAALSPLPSSAVVALPEGPTPHDYTSGSQRIIGHYHQNCEQKTLHTHRTLQLSRQFFLYINQLNLSQYTNDNRLIK